MRNITYKSIMLLPVLIYAGWFGAYKVGIPYYISMAFGYLLGGGVFTYLAFRERKKNATKPRWRETEEGGSFEYK